MGAPDRLDRRSFTVEAAGKKFATVCRADGYWVMTWLSKTKRRAAWKGRQFVDGIREPRKYVWAWHGSLPSPFIATIDS